MGKGIGASWRRSGRGRVLGTALGVALSASLWSGLAAAETAAVPNKAAAAGTTAAGVTRPDQMAGLYGTQHDFSVLELRHEGGRYLARLVDFMTWEIVKDLGDWEIVDAARIRLGDEMCEYTFRPYRLLLTGCSLQGQWRTACRMNGLESLRQRQSSRPASEREACELVWSHLWPLARTGDHASLSQLAWTLRYMPALTAMAGGAIVIIPPGTPSSPESATPSASVTNDQIILRRVVEHIVALELYGWKCSVPGLPDAYVVESEVLRSIASCTAPEAEADQCLKDAIRLGLVPEFSDYVRMVEREGIANLQCVSKGIQK